MTDGQRRTYDIIEDVVRLMIEYKELTGQNLVIPEGIDLESEAKSDSSDDVLSCSFCFKGQHDVIKLIAGPDVFICGECAAVCIGITCEEMVEAGDSSMGLLSQTMSQLLAGNQGFAEDLMALLKAQYEVDDVLAVDGEGAESAESPSLICSFCGKNEHEVKKLVGGETAFICDECVVLCMDIIREEPDGGKT